MPIDLVFGEIGETSSSGYKPCSVEEGAISIIEEELGYSLQKLKENPADSLQRARAVSHLLMMARKQTEIEHYAAAQTSLEQAESYLREGQELGLSMGYDNFFKYIADEQERITKGLLVNDLDVWMKKAEEVNKK